MLLAILEGVMNYVPPLTLEPAMRKQTCITLIMTLTIITAAQASDPLASGGGPPTGMQVQPASTPILIDDNHFLAMQFDALYLRFSWVQDFMNNHGKAYRLDDSVKQMILQRANDLKVLKRELSFQQIETACSGLYLIYYLLHNGEKAEIQDLALYLLTQPAVSEAIELAKRTDIRCSFTNWLQEGIAALELKIRFGAFHSNEDETKAKDLLATFKKRLWIAHVDYGLQKAQEQKTNDNLIAERGLCALDDLASINDETYDIEASRAGLTHYLEDIDKRRKEWDAHHEPNGRKKNNPQKSYDDERAQNEGEIDESTSFIPSFLTRGNLLKAGIGCALAAAFFFGYKHYTKQLDQQRDKKK